MFAKMIRYATAFSLLGLAALAAPASANPVTSGTVVLTGHISTPLPMDEFSSAAHMKKKKMKRSKMRSSEGLSPRERTARKSGIASRPGYR